MYEGANKETASGHYPVNEEQQLPVTRDIVDYAHDLNIQVPETNRQKIGYICDVCDLHWPEGCDVYANTHFTLCMECLEVIKAAVLEKRRAKEELNQVKGA